MKKKYYSNLKILNTKSCFYIFGLVIALLLIGTHPIYAQGSGSISGTVVDSVSGEALPGVNVFFEGTSIGSSTNTEGKFSVYQIPSGDYTVIVTFIGYKVLKMPVTIEARKKLEFNFKLEYLAYETDEVVVTAQASGQMGAINQQLASSTITNVVSADRIQDVPDVNAAESVSRLPGLSLKRSGGEGQKVAIRGLSPKYNVMMINGVRMQSTDRNDRSVDLNMISPNVLSGIEVTKALTANMDADAVGGTVNLRTAKAADGFKGKFSAQGGYSSLADTYGNYRGTAFLSNRFFSNRLGVQVSGYIDHYDRSSDVLRAGRNTNETSDTEDGLVNSDLRSASVTSISRDRERLGGSLVFDYKMSKGSLIMNNFVSKVSNKQTSQSNSFTHTGKSFNASTSDTQKSNNTVISNALQGEFDFSFISMDFSVSNSISKQHVPGNTSMNINMKQSASAYTVPTEVSENISDITPSEYLASVELIDRELFRTTRFQTLERDVTAQAQEAMLNFNIPYTISKSISGNIKFGGKYIRNTRDNDETQYQTDPDRDQEGEAFVTLVGDSLWPELGLTNEDIGLGIRASLFEDPNYDVGNFLNGDANVNDFWYKGDVSKMNHYVNLAKDNGYYVIDLKESNQYDYDYTRNLMAFYASAEFNIGKYVTFTPGIRYENFNIEYSAYNTHKYGQLLTDFSSEEVYSDENKGENWFPQMHLRIKPTEWFDIRLASTKSIIYPDYRAISPYIYYDSFSSPSLSLGNTTLEPALSQNFDIYASVFQSKLGLFTAGVFYKEIENLMVSSSFLSKDPESINNRFELKETQLTSINTWINLDATSTVKGFELDWQTHLWYLPSFLKGIVLNINYTHISSETEYPFQTTVREGTGPFAKVTYVDSTRVGRMIDQPDDIFNFTFGYDIGGFSARISYVYTDNVLTGVNRAFPKLDSSTDAYKRWDFTAYQQLPLLNNGLQIYVNINNITDTPDRTYYYESQDLASLEYYGRTVDLGLRYTF